MLDGRLKRYKIGVVALHAINNWMVVPGNMPYTGAMQACINAVVTHAATNIPAGLGNGAGKLWQSTFQGQTARTKSFVGMILTFLTEDPNAVTAAGGPGGPGGGGNPNALGGGNNNSSSQNQNANPII